MDDKADLNDNREERKAQSSLSSFFPTLSKSSNVGSTNQPKFTAITDIPGLYIITDFIDLKTEQSLMSEIDKNQWSNDLARRTQQYGFKYNYKSRRIDKTMQCEAIPEFIQPLLPKIAALTTSDFKNDEKTTEANAKQLFAQHIDQCIINEYKPGQGIGAHVDCTPCFKETVCSLSLNSAAAMVFANCKRRDLGKLEFHLPRRSLVLMTGPARYEWTHQIPSRRSDPQSGARRRRVSLTFRAVILDEANDKKQ